MAPDGLPVDDAVAVRSVLAASDSLRLCAGPADNAPADDLAGAHAVLADGTIVLAVDALTPTGGRLVAARGRAGGVRIEVTSVIPVSVRCRVRARVTVTGTVRPLHPALLDAGTPLCLLDLPPVALWAVEPVAVHLRRHARDGDVPVAAYRAAQPDPFAAVEATHLHRLARRSRAKDIPVAVDADGLTLRTETADGHRDVRLPFSCRPATEDELTRELTLVTAARPA